MGLKKGYVMGMFDTITGVPVECPKCGDKSGKNVQIKSGPQQLNDYEFGKDKIPLDWDYVCYGAVIEKIDEENGKIRGIAECAICKKRVDDKLEAIKDRYKKAGKIKCPDNDDIGEHKEELFECNIDGDPALKIIFQELDKELKTDHSREYLFETILTIKDGIIVEAELLSN